MKIYFAGSIRGGRDDRDFYHLLIQYLKQYGEVLCEHIGKDNLSAAGEENENNLLIHNRDLEWLVSADALIAEVTTPSLGVGYEIGRALEKQKPILCLYRIGSPKKLSAMIAGSPELTVAQYADIQEAYAAIDSFLSDLSY